MKYIAAVDHRCSLASYVRRVSRSFVLNLSTPFLKPYVTEIDTCFVVGCGHSGTTLLAAKLGSSPECLLINRETGVFLPAKGLHCSREIIREWIYITRFLEKRCLIEKTPKHVHFVHRIMRVFPNSRILAVVRNPLDTCASLHKRFGDLDFAIDRWLIDNKPVCRFQTKPYVLTVKYEDMTEHPNVVFDSVAKFIGVEWTEEMLSSEVSPFNKGNLDGDPSFGKLRAKQVMAPIRPNSGKWPEVLTDIEAQSVLKRTAELANQLGYTDAFLQEHGIYPIS